MKANLESGPREVQTTPNTHTPYCFPYLFPQVIGRFLQLADTLRRLGNYDFVFAIHRALTSSAISRLESTWAIVNQYVVCGRARESSVERDRGCSTCLICSHTWTD